MNFVVVDLEWANEKVHTICQIGLVTCKEGQLVDPISQLIDPEVMFAPANVNVHKIDDSKVSGMPTFADVAEHVRDYMDGRVCVSHSKADEKPINDAFDLLGLKPPICKWVNSETVAKRTWKLENYQLKTIAKHLGIDFEHHDALEDAKAAAKVMLAAIDKTGKSVEEWYEELNKKPVDGRWHSHETGEGNPDGEFFGNEILFTGFDKEVEVIFAATARELGFRVTGRLTKRNTTHCCHSDEPPEATIKAGKDKTTKHAKALVWNKEVWSETEFRLRFLSGS